MIEIPDDDLEDGSIVDLEAKSLQKAQEGIIIQEDDFVYPDPDSFACASAAAATDSKLEVPSESNGNGKPEEAPSHPAITAEMKRKRIEEIKCLVLQVLHS